MVHGELGAPAPSGVTLRLPPTPPPRCSGSTSRCSVLDRPGRASPPETDSPAGEVPPGSTPTSWFPVMRRISRRPPPVRPPRSGKTRRKPGPFPGQSPGRLPADPTVATCDEYRSPLEPAGHLFSGWFCGARMRLRVRVCSRKTGPPVDIMRGRPFTTPPGQGPDPFRGGAGDDRIPIGGPGYAVEAAHPGPLGVSGNDPSQGVNPSTDDHLHRSRTRDGSLLHG